MNPRFNGLQLPGGTPAQPQVQIAAPINDIQLVVLAAANIYGRGAVTTPPEAVKVAIEIVKLSILAVKDMALGN